ncbi:glycoside hydrolase family 1 protein [Enterococcus hulanensis]|uniref:glycoside hydrolase family 1 protein n=1 Tax=Enterococcus TaxID=1350 RepID=UPI000B5A72BC|nr:MULTISPECIES: glycoside hydrolase family 1 protein [Enterococcus]MBO0410106.1 glycoside hydrolase family 1 protein [Enterococcus hulanensis]MDT2661994.1 glycoside hydrolase family 1 protein [Enterococcus hulanensis]OTO18955.1 beta-glucosidase [Enterococcus sp. 3H8_DIV0648]
MKTFPNNFWWGAATSGPQSEGRFNKKHANVFDYHFEIEPEKFHNQVGPDVASNFYNSYKEDIHMMRSIGMNSLRTSIQWSRLIDDLETNTVNQDAVDFYNNVIDTMLAEGMTPVMNLHHFDLPVELYDKYGGWESKKVVELYVGFAEKCFELFGDRVKFWATHNEPMVVVEGEYLFQFHYPNIVNGKKAVQVAYNLNLASAKAIQAFRKLNIADAQIGTILNLTPTYAASDAPEDQEAARIAELWNNKMFLEPAVYGHFPAELEELLTKDKVLWETSDEEKEILKNNTVDFLGVNFYHPNRVKAPDVAPNSVGEWMPDRYYDAYDMPGRRVNLDRGWEIYPKALYDIAVNIKENYKNIPWYVSENGMGVSNEERFKNSAGMIEDDYRIDFVQEHLDWLHKGIEEGSNCFGYHMWTPIDCWSWLNSYKNRYGFISNNIHTQIKTIKKSGYWFKEVTERNGLEG